MPLNLIFIQPGNYSIEDNGIPGDNTSVIKDGNGVVIFTFAHPADGLGLTVTTTGVNITFNFTDSMGAANFTIGSLTNPSESPDSIIAQNIVTTGTVTLVANNNIAEGSDADAASDITAGAVVLSAVSGIGTAANPIETRTGLFEAETTTGGIAISNIGAVQIGGIAADVDGMDVATSGDITFTNLGSIFLTEANSVTASEVVHGGGTSGNVTLIASGANSDIIANVDNAAVSVPRGSLTASAGRDIQLGTIGADFNNDVVTNNNLMLTAGRDVLIDGFADILSDNFGLNTGARLTITAGRNIGILNLAGTSASVAASGAGGGDLFLTTGSGGSLTVNGPGSFGAGSTSGDVVVRADRILIDSGSGISAPSGAVTIAPATDGREMILGSAGDAAPAVELSDLELNRIFTPSLNIGSNDAGAVNVISAIAINAAGTAPNVTIRTSTDILIGSNISTVASLSLRAFDNIFQAPASTITTPALTANVDVVNDDPGSGNTANFAGSIVGVNGIIGNNDNDTLIGNGAANTLSGLGGNDVLQGFAGNDILTGGTGADTMSGGADNDTYSVDNAGDSVIENVGEGTDIVQTFITYTLGANVENLRLMGGAAINGTGNTLNNSMLGNNAANALSGGDGNDIINGGAGADTMAGGIGNDTFFVDNLGDNVIENVGEGTDTVQTTINYTLTANVENLRLIGSALTGTGNTSNNAILGNGLSNALNGAGGNDALNGAGGQDALTGGTGADTFLFAPGEFGGLTISTCDRVMDFSHADGDKIDVSLVDADAGLGGDQAFTFIGNSGFHNVAGELRYEQISGNTYVSGDVNGDGIADFIIRVDGLQAFVSADFGL